MTSSKKSAESRPFYQYGCVERFISSLYSLYQSVIRHYFVMFIRDLTMRRAVDLSLEGEGRQHHDY